MWEVKKDSRFLSTGHGILPSCGCKARETMVAKCKLVLLGNLTKPYLAENFSLQSSNCNILGLADTVTFFANEDGVTQI